MRRERYGQADILPIRRKSGGPAQHAAGQGAFSLARPPYSPAEHVPDPVVAAFLVDSPMRQARYRYRTAVLVGPWRSRSDEARADAVRARQAAIDAVGGFVWVVDGSIEIGCPTVDDKADPKGWGAH